MEPDWEEGETWRELYEVRTIRAERGLQPVRLVHMPYTLGGGVEASSHWHPLARLVWVSKLRTEDPRANPWVGLGGGSRDQISKAGLV